MATNFKPIISGNQSGYPEVRYFTVDASATFVVGELVYWDTATQTLKGCGADPSLIAGIALASAAFGLGTQWPGNIYDNAGVLTAIPVALLTPTTKVFMSSSSTPALSNVGVAYGVASNSGVWRVDTSDTSNTRLVVVDIFNTPQQEGFLVQFLAANLQFDAVAS